MTGNEHHSEHSAGLDGSQVGATRVVSKEGKVRRLSKLSILMILAFLVFVPVGVDTQSALGGTVPPIPTRISPWATENNIYIEDLGK
jgi:hypothetical protein